MGDTSAAGYQANASHLMIRNRVEFFDQGIWLSASQLGKKNGDGNEYISFVGPTTPGKWVRTTNGNGTNKKAFNIKKQRAFFGLDAGQGQVALSDGSAEMTDNSGLQRAVKLHAEPTGGVNINLSEVLMTSHCH